MNFRVERAERRNKNEIIQNKEGMNAILEIRVTILGYLTRSDHSSALDLNFGKDAGAGVVLLLINGFSGVTVTGVAGGKVQ